MNKKTVNRFLWTFVIVSFGIIMWGLGTFFATGDFRLFVTTVIVMIAFVLGYTIGTAGERAKNSEREIKQKKLVAKMAQWTREEENQSVDLGVKPRFDSDSFGA